MTWAARYVGIPYADNDTTEGLHCWGLVQAVLDREAGVEVPSYGETSARDLAAVARQVEGDADIDPWSEVPSGEARAFDVVVMSGRVRSNGTSRRAPIHVGVMIDAARILHVEQATDAVIVPLTHDTIRFRILKICRHKALI